MESAEEFIRRYLREKTDLENSSSNAYMPFHEKYCTSEFFKLHSDFYGQRKPEELVSIEVGDQKARIITNHPFYNRDNRHRYILCVVDGQWKISSREAECFACHSSGKRGENKCHVCGGIGWKDYMRSAT